jgi:2-haloacid dehalogenase
MAFTAVEVLAFDVFGTVVDVRGSLRARVAEFAAANGIAVDSHAFANDWVLSYAQAIDAIGNGAPFKTVEIVTREVLDNIVAHHGLAALNSSARNELNRAWRRLDPWLHEIAGLQRLRTRFQLVTLANGNLSFLRDLATYAGWRWDQILSAAVVKR